MPADVDLLGEGDGGVVVGDLARGGSVARREGDAVVDVEDAGGAAGRPDDGGGGDLVLLGVDLAVGPDPAAVDGGAGRGLFCLCVSVSSLRESRDEELRGRELTVAAASWEK